MYRYIGVLQKVVGAQQTLGSFTLNGGSTLQSLAHFYGLRLPVPDPCMTLAEYLARTCYGQPRTGDRVLLDRKIELSVRELDEGRIRTVRLRILGDLPERRAPSPFEGAHNFMRRASDREPDRHANPKYTRRFNELRRPAD